ncbi:MAG: hypothetical protein ACT4QE_19615 [Anaerolineales bacterium]
MAKTFYTEHDIDAAHQRGVTSLDIHDGIVLTDLALERALKYGLRLNRVATAARTAGPADADLHQRVRAAVLARLNNQVDTALLDAVIAKVLSALK